VTASQARVNSKTQTLNFKPSTPKLFKPLTPASVFKSSTPNHKPQTLNPKPQARKRTGIPKLLEAGALKWQAPFGEKVDLATAAFHFPKEKGCSSGAGSAWFAVAAGTHAQVVARCAEQNGVLASIHSDDDGARAGGLCPSPP